MVKLIIAGSRSFNDYRILCESLDLLLKGKKDVQIVSGTAQGADLLGERYAIDKGLEIIRFPADWEKYGKRAGYIRNRQMGEYADCAIVFWDGFSKGTKMMIGIMKELGKPIRIYNYAINKFT